MTVDNPVVVDFVAYDPNGSVLLVMVEHRPWDGTDQRLYELQKNVNNYVSFAQEGELLRRYPDAGGRQVKLELRYVDPPDPKTTKFLERIREALEVAGFTVTLKQLGIHPMG